MYCPRCGNQAEDGARFCDKCGMAIVDEGSPDGNKGMHTLPVDTVPERNGNKKKRIRIPILIAVIAIIVAGIAVLALKNEGEIYIGSVKEGSPELYPGITYGQAFDNFFSNPEWEYFESEDGQDVVEFSGGCLFADAEVTARIQFILDIDNGTFTVGYFDMDGVPQSDFMAAAIIAAVFEDYRSPESDHAIGEDTGKPGAGGQKAGNGDGKTQEADNASLDRGGIDYVETGAEEDVPAEGKTGYACEGLANEYIRTTGPCSYINVWAADEAGVTFAAAIGCSGWSAYRDMRDCMAEWASDTTAVFDQGDGKVIKLHFGEEGLLSVEEDGIDSDAALSLAGTYCKSTGMDLGHAGFVLPNSDSQFVREKDLAGLGPIECKIARNEIYARHGRMFADEQLQNYFESCAWYKGEIPGDEFDVSILNDYEQENANLIAAYEEKMGYR